MGDLFFNKLAGAIIGVGLLVMGLMELSHRLFENETPDVLALPVDLSAVVVAAAPEEEEDTGPVDFGVLLANADISAGERVARRCATCHNFGQGEGNITGPYMWDVMGREVGSIADYGYSSAMIDYAAGGVVWGFQNMYDYLENPRDYVPGTAMSFAGLRNQDDRINIIAYMRSLSESPIDLPAPLAAAIEAAPAGIEEAAAVAEDAGDAVDAAVDAAEEVAGDIVEDAPEPIEPPVEGGDDAAGDDEGGDDEGGEGEDG